MSIHYMGSQKNLSIPLVHLFTGWQDWLANLMLLWMPLVSSFLLEVEQESSIWMLEALGKIWIGIL